MGTNWPAYPSGAAGANTGPYNLAAIQRPANLQICLDNNIQVHSVAGQNNRWNMLARVEDRQERDQSGPSLHALVDGYAQPLLE